MTDPIHLIADKKQKAIALFTGGYLMDAKILCDELITTNGQDPELLCLLSAIDGKLGNYQKAIKYSRKAIELAPGYMAPYSNLAQALMQVGDMAGLQDAVSCLRTVIEQNNQDHETYLNLGDALQRIGRHDEAIQSFRSAHQLNPDLRDAVAGEAGVLEALGDTVTAYEKIRPFLTDRPLNPKIATIYGKIAEEFKLQENAVEALEFLLSNESLEPDDASKVQFVLGSLHDKLGQFDEAFLHYKEGNELKPVYFDRFKHSRIVGHLRNRFTRNYLRHAHHSTVSSDRPVFVVGMTRSGTSLVEQILSAHPGVYGAGELGDIDRLISTLPGGILGKTELAQTDLDRCARDYLTRLNELNSDAAHVVDKMPQNFMNLAHIELFFPNSHIIHCRRDPLDTCLSNYFQRFSAALSYSFDLQDIGFFYSNYQTMMAHWQKTLSIPIHEVVYEDLVNDPEKETEKLLGACGLHWDDRCLEFYSHSRVVRTASYNQVRQPVYSSSVGRWKNYERHLQPLIASLNVESEIP